MLTLLPILTLLVGGVLVLVGCRGRLLDDHPWCRKCRFDLFQVWPDRQTCPECGADLSANKAVGLGQRKRRPGMRLTGYGFLLVGAVGVGLVVWMGLSDSWQSIKPVWWLRMEANAAGVAEDGALKELNRRLMVGTLSSIQMQQVVDDALLAQADMGRPWNEQWGDFVEKAQTKNAVTPAKWTKYLEQAMASPFRLEMRPTIRKGDPIGYKVHERGGRVGSTTRFWLRYRTKNLKVGTVSIPVGGGGGSGFDSNGAGSWASSRDVSDEQWRKLKTGRHEVQMSLDLELEENSASGTKLARKTVTLKTTVQVTPADRPTLTVVKDPALRAKVEQAITVSRLRLDADSKNRRHFYWSITVDHAPVGVAFDVFVRSGDQEWEASSFNVPADRESNWGGHSDSDQDMAGFTADKVDIVLRPNRDKALGTVDVIDMWNEEVVIKDVPVDWRAPKP